MSKKTKIPSVRILKIDLYNNSRILIQQIPKADIFQALIYRDDRFYQVHEIITPIEGKKALSEEEILKCTAVIWQYAMQVADKLEDLANPMKAGVKAD